MSSRQSRASKRSLAVSTTSTNSTARSSSAGGDYTPSSGGGGAGAGSNGGDRGPLSSVLSDDDGIGGAGVGGRGRRGMPTSADDSSVVSLSFRSTSGAASNSKGGNAHATAAAVAAMADLNVSLSTLGGSSSALGGIGSGGASSSSAGRAEVAELMQQLDPSDPRLHLASLNDERSAFGAVSRSCLALNQWATGGVGGSVDDGGMDLAAGGGSAGPTVCSSLLLCPSDHAAVAIPTLRSLITCCTAHTDRRCRILALQTLALVGRSVYA